MNIEKSTREDNLTVGQGLDEFNKKHIPFTVPITHLNYHIKDGEGKIVAGIVAVLGYWGGLQVNVLWTSESERGKGYGSALMMKAEEEAKNHGAVMAWTDTFDFQAKDFYIKNGYEIFGVFEGFPGNHKRYYLKKAL